MTAALSWASAVFTVGVLVDCEAVRARSRRGSSERLARTPHTALRAEWFIAVSQQPGSELLAVQTLRNAQMSATMTASTSALGLIGTVTLVAPSLNAAWAATGTAYVRRTGLLCSWGLLRRSRSWSCALDSTRSLPPNTVDPDHGLGPTQALLWGSDLVHLRPGDHRR